MELISRVINAIVNTHPWHSMVVHFPIGLTGAALSFILLALWKRSDAFEKTSFFIITLAAVSVVVAGLAGLRDNAIRFHGIAPYIGQKISLATTLLLLTTG